MNKIVFPPKPHMKRAGVGDLHQPLTALGLEIAAKERKEALPLSPSDKIVIFDDRPSPNLLILKSEGDLLPSASALPHAGPCRPFTKSMAWSPAMR